MSDSDGLLWHWLWLVGGVGEFPRGEFAGGSVQAFGDGEVRGCGWHSGEGFADERVDGQSEEEEIGVAAADDVDIRLGARHRRI
ncbi:MAG: hypothetical protein KDB24_00770, partial [Microthrixaceae bacterium]|nr:hypothetical protein [Microthrixaceae bacterium]